MVILFSRAPARSLITAGTPGFPWSGSGVWTPDGEGPSGHRAPTVVPVPDGPPAVVVTFLPVREAGTAGSSPVLADMTWDPVGDAEEVGYWLPDREERTSSQDRALAFRGHLVPLSPAAGHFSWGCAMRRCCEWPFGRGDQTFHIHSVGPLSDDAPRLRAEG